MLLESEDVLVLGLTFVGELKVRMIVGKGLLYLSVLQWSSPEFEDWKF